MPDPWTSDREVAKIDAQDRAYAERLRLEARARGRAEYEPKTDQERPS